MPDVSLVASFGAGILSFISPCVLPLVPGYISFVSGVSFDQMRAAGSGQARRTRGRLLLTSLAFVIGFSLVFIAFGAGASAIGQSLRRHWLILEKIAGVVVILFGLHLAGVFRIKWLDMDARLRTSGRPVGLAGAFLVGTAFAFGWSPCLGPILGGILTIAGSRETVTEGVVLLAVYSAGLGIPFLLTSVAVDRFFAASARIRRHYRTIELVAGLLLVVLGVLIVTNRFTVLSRYLDRWFPWLTQLT